MQLIFLVFSWLLVATTNAQQDTARCSASFSATLDSVNALLRIHSDYSHHLLLHPDGAAQLKTRSGGFHFNFRLLESERYPEGTDVNGIEWIACDERRHAPFSRIYFRSRKGAEAFIKLPCLDDAVVKELHRLLVCLHREVMKS